MRPLSLLLPASLLVLGSSVLAQTTPAGPASQSAATPISTVQVSPAVQGRRIPSDHAQQLAGTYAMSNGWQLQVRAKSRFISASINQEEPIRLVQVAPYKFASGDGNVRMEFNQGEWGDDMTMSYVPDPRLAQVVVISSKMAQR